MKVLCSVCLVRWVEERPKIDVARMPARVGVPDWFSSIPARLRRVWRLSKAEVIGDGGRTWSCDSSRFAQSITINILQEVSSILNSFIDFAYPSTSPSTFAKNLVNSIANVFRLSLRSSSSLTMIGAEVMFVVRTLSPKSHTATPVA